MRRELVWMDQPRFRGWGCSQCARVFNPLGPPIGETFDAIKQTFESHRDKEFARTLALNTRANQDPHVMLPKTYKRGNPRFAWVLGEGLLHWRITLPQRCIFSGRKSGQLRTCA
jgi:hypothetical protein